ncbi:hypothetical protein HY486_02770 [Candidatus Woesearchaeota archaeon]|nr:hypothetical protein [Candidatus Woesearchaeota archaeon]
MATLLDIGLLKGLAGIFPLLFIFAIIYAVLIRMEMFKDRQLLVAIIAIVLAFAGLLTPVVARTIVMAAPFYVMLFVFAILAILAYSSFGIKEDTIIETLTGAKYGSTFALWILAIILIITLGSFSEALSQEKTLTTGQNASAEPKGETKGVTNIIKIITHPKVLGMALILLVAMFAIKYITDNP